MAKARKRIVRTYSIKDEEFFRHLVIPEGDLEPEVRWSRWRGRGVRRFRSPNVVYIEHYRRPRACTIFVDLPQHQKPPIPIGLLVRLAGHV
jgi:hypothetical protein